MSDPFLQDDDYGTLAEAIEERLNDALGDFLDITAELAADLRKGAVGAPFSAYLAELHSDCVKHVRLLVSVDAGDIGAVRAIQVALATYITAVEFAKRQLRAYSASDISGSMGSEGEELDGD